MRVRAFWGASVIGLLVASGSAASADQAGLIVKGQAIAAERCARCHATGAIDKSPHDRAPPFRLVVERYPSEHLAEAMAEGLRTGHTDMPVFVFDPPEIEAFLAYLDSLAPAVRGPVIRKGQ